MTNAPNNKASNRLQAPPWLTQTQRRAAQQQLAQSVDNVLGVAGGLSAALLSPSVAVLLAGGTHPGTQAPACLTLAGVFFMLTRDTDVLELAHAAASVAPKAAPWASATEHKVFFKELLEELDTGLVRPRWANFVCYPQLAAILVIGEGAAAAVKDIYFKLAPQGAKHKAVEVDPDGGPDVSRN